MLADFPARQPTRITNQSLLYIMEPFFSPLVREKVKTLISCDLDLQSDIKSYIEEYAHSYAEKNTIDIGHCMEEIHYLVLSVLDEVAIIERYTAFNHSHVFRLYYSLVEKVKKLCGSKKNLKEYQEWITLTFQISLSLLDYKYNGIHFWESINTELLNIDTNYFYFYFGGERENRLAHAVKTHLAIESRYNSSISNQIRNYIYEERIIQEQEAQSKKINVVTWNAIIDNLKTVNLEHLDAFHSFFSKLATKYTQDDEKLRKNLEKLSDEVDECKKNKSKSTIVIENAQTVIDNHDGGQTKINIQN